ncbi:MAG TPA: hypothetical protein VGE59_02580 [Patescibacteria group bacterium]
MHKIFSRIVIGLLILFGLYIMLGNLDSLLDYQDFKMIIVYGLDLAKDAIHIYLGFLAWLISVLFFHRSPRTPQVLVLGFVFSLLMELADIRGDWIQYRSPDWMGSLHDIVHTNMIPTLLFIFFRTYKEEEIK